jgi:hypothetical protein
MHELRNTEIAQFNLSGGRNKDVSRADVSVNNSLSRTGMIGKGMGITQRSANFPGNKKGILKVELPAGVLARVQQAAKAGARNVFHDEERPAVFTAELKRGGDVAMGHIEDDPGFFQKPGFRLRIVFA